MAFDFKAIARLPADQRLAALEQLEDELRKLIEKRKEEIKQSQREIEEAEALFERAREELVVLEKVATPGAKGVKIDDLFFKQSKRQEKQELEDTVEEETINKRRQEEYMRSQAEEAARALYENKPKQGLSEEQASTYLRSNQDVMERVRADYESSKREYETNKQKKVKTSDDQEIVSQGVYKSNS